MKNKITPSQRNIDLPEESFIVSKTDTRGLITYCNRVFIQISGFTEQELLGKQHNIVRHPDMPRAVFHMLWQYLKQKKSLLAISKICARTVITIG